VKNEKVKGVTELTMEKHKFEGFNVRMQKGGYTVRQYVSSNVKSQGDYPKAARREMARTQAIKLRGILEDTFSNTKSWRSGSLTKAAQKELTDLGFTIREVVAV
jgi:hypothetical protein